MNCWVEVNLAAICHNFRQVQALVGDTRIIAVVKANAYGHGAVEVARALAAEGATMLAVARLEEALPLRAAGVSTPILLLTPAAADEANEVVAHDITACLTTTEEARCLSVAASNLGKTAVAHLQIDTGMARLGVAAEQAVSLAQNISEFPSLHLDGAFTHFGFAAEADPADTHRQFVRFGSLMHALARATGVPESQMHCANSAALLRFPTMRLSCSRPGTILYGQYPSPLAAEAAHRQRLQLREGFAVKARILDVRGVRSGQTVGYGGEWRAKRASLIATLAVGYADGLTLEPNARAFDAGKAFRASLKQTAKRAAQVAGLQPGDKAGTARIGQYTVPIVGRVAMQLCSIDVSEVRGVAAGDVAEVWMRRTSAGAHLPRVYVHDSESP